MAEYLSIHQTTYSVYELGNLNIPVQVLDKIADLFETSIDYLANRTDEKKPYPKKNNFQKQEQFGISVEVLY